MNNIKTEYVEKSDTDQMIDQLIKENDILSKLSKGKLSPNEALNSLYSLLLSQRGKLDYLTEDNLSLHQSIEQLNLSISSLQKNNPPLHNKSSTTNSIKQSSSIHYNPTELLSFSSLVGNTPKNKPNIDLGNLMQMSVTNFQKKTLNPISLPPSYRSLNLNSTNNSISMNSSQETKPKKKKKKPKPIPEENDK